MDADYYRNLEYLAHETQEVHDTQNDICYLAAVDEWISEDEAAKA